MSTCPTVHSPREASPSCLSQFLPVCEHKNMCVPALFRSGVLPVWGPRSRAWGFPLLLLLLPLLLGGPGSGAAAVTLFPHGASEGDLSLTRAEDARSPRIPLPGSFTLADQQFSSVFIYDDGWITLNNSAPYGDFDYYADLDVPCICVYCAYANLSLGGDVTYRVVRNPNMTSFSDVLPPNFSPAWALVATWFDVRADPAPDKTNTYQALMTSDGSRSVLLLLYDAVTWYDDRNSPDTTFVWAGYTTGNGIFVALNTSRTSRILDLDTRSNIGKPGLFFFQLSTDPETSTTATSSVGTTTASSTVGTTTASSTVGTNTTSSSVGTTTASSSVGTTTASSSVGTTTTSSSVGTTTASSSVGTITTTSSVGTNTTTSTVGTNTTTSTVGTTTTTSTVGTTTTTSTVGTITASSTVGTITTSSTVGTIATSSTVGTNTERNSGSGESSVGLLLTAHFVAVVVTSTLILLVSIVLVAISWSRCFPKANRKLDARVSPVVSGVV